MVKDVDDGSADRAVADTDGGDGPGGDAVTGDGSAGEGAATIGAPGGRVVSADGLLMLDVPRGALTQEVGFTITAVAMPPAGALSGAYDIAPRGLRFSKPARIIFKASAAAAGDGGVPLAPRAATFAGNHWIQVPPAKPDGDGTSGAITGAVVELGRYALVAGFCAACTTTCDPATCKFGTDNTIAGKCASYGNGCTRCVPACDGDGDGFCPGHPGQDLPGGDCNDADPLASPAAAEICGNHVDDDCDGNIDEGCTPCKSDGECTVGLQACIDGYCDLCDSGCKPETCVFGDGPTAVPGRCQALDNGCSRCVPVCDTDGDGFCPGTPSGRQPGGDCDDTKREVRPNGREICGNGVDDDCNGLIDDLCATCSKDSDCKALQGCRDRTCATCTATCTAATCRFSANEADPGVAGKCVPFGNGCSVCIPVCDGDGDGVCPGAPANGQPGNDCRDSDPNVHPGAPEICGNGVDDDCDGHVDEGCTVCTSDDDCTQGLEACIQGVCDVCPGDCDPMRCRFGVTDVPGSGVAGRCAAFGKGCSRCVPACDADGDGYCPGKPGSDQPGGDCNDLNASIHPGTVELCGNETDDNCDGNSDEGCATCGQASACPASESCTTAR